MRKSHRFLVSVVAAAVVWLAPAVHAQAQTASTRQADYIVAVVNSEPITNHEVQLRMQRVAQQAAQEGARLPAREELARQVLERLIVERAQVHLAKDTGVRVDEASIDQAELTVARNNRLDVAELRRRMERDGITRAQFRDDLKQQIMLTRLREREIEPKVKVSDVEIDQFLREQATAPSAEPTEINLAQILVTVPENASPSEVAARQARAQEVLKRARAGEDFVALARAYSDGPERESGGEMGMRSLDRYPTLFLDATTKLAVGAVSEPVRSGAGFHVLKVLDKKQAGGAATSITQNHARHILLRVSAQQTEAAARERLLGMKRRLVAGQADFASLARASSQDGSAAEGGDLGWSNPGQFVPEFEEVIDNLKPGEISDPLVSRFGVHLIQLLERRQYTLTTREQREVARNMVRERKLDEAYTSWVQDVRARAYVEMREPPQ